MASYSLPCVGDKDKLNGMDRSVAKRYLPWVVATALFMEQLDSTIINTAVPSIAASLCVTPLSLKAVVASYIQGLAVCIPISGWIADRFGTRCTFATAIALFTLSSVLCGLSINVPMMVTARILQGMGAAMMVPVGRLTVVRTFPKDELLHAMNFVSIPGLVGPLLGPPIGGLIVNWLSWRTIFFVNIPVGIAALVLVYRYMPNYYGDESHPLDLMGLFLFGSGIALLSWILEIFGEHCISSTSIALLVVLAFSLLTAYMRHSRNRLYPLLKIALFKIRTFNVSVVGGFITRLGIGGLPFLLPLFYQLGLGLPAWHSGLLMVPTALASIGMKFVTESLLRRYGYRSVLIVNTIFIGITIYLYACITTKTPEVLIIFLSSVLGFCNSMQFSCMNSLVYADINQADSSMASTIASVSQQLSLSFGLACSSLVAGWYLKGLSQSDHTAVINALHYAFTTLGVLTILSSFFFLKLRANDGESISHAHLHHG